MLQPGGFVFLQRVEVVQALQKEQLGDLLNDLQGMGNAAGPEGIPEGIDFAADFTGDHLGAMKAADDKPRQESDAPE